MTLSRYHLVFGILVIVVGIGVGVAVFYVEDVFKEREKQVDRIREGRTEDLVGKPLPKPPPAQPPLERSTSRSVEVLELRAPRGPADGPAVIFSRQILSIRGNGEFSRLPAGPDEPGPIVTGILDRARVDELIQAAGRVDRAPATHPETQKARLGPVNHGFGVAVLGRMPPETVMDGPFVRTLMTLTGKQMNRSAVPEQTWLRVEPIEEPCDVPWPFQRQKPGPFAIPRGAILVPEHDRARFREGLLKVLATDARFTAEGKTWKVTGAAVVLSP